MKTIDFEMVITCGIMALVAALGIVTGIVVFLGVRIYECNAALVSGSYFAISGIIWGILLVMNCEKVMIDCRKKEGKRL